MVACQLPSVLLLRSTGGLTAMSRQVRGVAGSLLETLRSVISNDVS